MPPGVHILAGSLTATATIHAAAQYPQPQYPATPADPSSLALALAEPSRATGAVHSAHIPEVALKLLENVGLITKTVTEMNGVQRIEYRISSQAMQYLSPYFQKAVK